MVRSTDCTWDEGPIASRRIKAINVHTLSVAEKRHFGMLINDKLASAANLSKFYSIGRKFLNKLAHKVRKNQPIRDTVGAQSIIDNRNLPKVKEFLRERKRNETATREDLKDFLAKDYEEQCDKEDLAPSRNIKCSDSWFRKQKKRLLSTGKGQTKTKARYEAKRDPRNAYSEYIGLKTLQEGLDPNLIANFDATQYYYNPDGEIKKLVWLKDDNDSPASYESSGGLGMFVKCYLLGTATGIVAPMVCCLAIKEMGDEEFIVEKIMGMSHTPAAGQFGYICFAKTRGCNAAFYRWYYSNVVIPFIDQQRLDNDLGKKDVYGHWTDDSMKALVTSDGEAIQIAGVFEDEILAALEFAKVQMGKHSASASDTTNCWDATNYCKASKKRSLQSINKHVKIGKEGIGRKIDDVLTRVIHFVTKARRDFICDAIIKIIVASQQTINLDSAISGFGITGQWPLDYKKKMATCSTKLSAAQNKNCIANVDHFCEIFKRNGKITEDEYDAKNIVRVDDDRTKQGLLKHQRVLHQHRFEQLNSKKTIEEFNAKQTAKVYAAVPRTELALLKKQQKKDDIAADKARTQQNTDEQNALRLRLKEANAAKKIADAAAKKIADAAAKKAAKPAKVPKAVPPKPKAAANAPKTVPPKPKAKKAAKATPKATINTPSIKTPVVTSRGRQIKIEQK